MSKEWEQKVSVMLQWWGWKSNKADGEHHPWNNPGPGLFCGALHSQAKSWFVCLSKKPARIYL